MKNLIRFDWAIKTVLRKKSNFDILEAFISDLIGLDIKIEEILESESNQQSATDKFNRADILVKDFSGNRYIVEIQNNEEKDYLKRMLYGTSKNIVENISIGEKYENIVKVISINIVYFELGLGYDSVYHGKMEFTGLKTNTRLNESNQMAIATYAQNTSYDPAIFPEYYIILPNRFTGEVKGKFDEWLYLLKNSEIVNNAQSKIMARVDEALNILQMTDVERRVYERQIQNSVIYETQVETAEQNGILKGKVLVYLEIGMTAEEIAEKLKIHEVEVSRIIDNLNRGV
ncbi:MAG: hypothetical protein ATN34_04065 [Epulopiscium sp. Nele67-Bin002]|nr:MAG: hypothetical protein ATN33_03665 [Epulopiscium sp. Nele67-Bin001]OON91611.1 MAG: hypothetical protein ATN34_04065 [Epulopiscium sp. Nele67-Bin002]